MSHPNDAPMPEAENKAVGREEPKKFEIPSFVLEADTQEGTLIRKPATPEITLHQSDVYADAIGKFRLKMIDLVKQGAMSEQTAAKIILEQEYHFFQQIVSVEYKTQEG
jgi:hypothetical protein